ncbi:hypothetical protein KC356_g9196 [Hortaea werneckii]|nr:hypothetical protein KC356_g9196 [Hortaea werneckii]
MKKEFVDVVDNKLKVYGIQNVRAVDVSVLPIQLFAHLSLYGIANKAATTIKEDQAGQRDSQASYGKYEADFPCKGRGRKEH